jgi:hypothetical protein
VVTTVFEDIGFMVFGDRGGGVVGSVWCTGVNGVVTDDGYGEIWRVIGKDVIVVNRRRGWYTHVAEARGRYARVMRGDGSTNTKGTGVFGGEFGIVEKDFLQMSGGNVRAGIKLCTNAGWCIVLRGNRRNGGRWRRSSREGNERGNSDGRGVINRQVVYIGRRETEGKVRVDIGGVEGIISRSKRRGGRR